MENKVQQFSKLKIKKYFSTKTNPILFPHVIKTEEKAINIIGDIFTNVLCYYKIYRKNKNTIYYSEYYNEGKSRYKKLIFYMLWNLFFRNKKFIVPHLLWQNTFKRISNKIFCLPQLYQHKIIDTPVERDDGKIRFLYAWDISSRKNCDFLVENFTKLYAEYPNTELLMIGKMSDLSEKYKNILNIKNRGIKYIEKLPFEELEKKYQESDVFILASLSEPIGAVVQEAMANGNMIIVSNLAWASCYVDNGENGLIFDVQTRNDLLEKMRFCVKNREKVLKMRKNAVEIMRSKYSIFNEKMLKELYNRFLSFIESE